MSEPRTWQPPSKTLPAGQATARSPLGRLATLTAGALLALGLGGCATGTGASSDAALWSYPTDSLDVHAVAATADITAIVDSDSLVGVSSQSGGQQWSAPGAFGSVQPDQGVLYATCCTEDRGKASVAAVQGDSGEVRWTVERKASSGSVVFAPPTVAQGTVFVSSSDDELFAVDAASGKELWTVDTSAFGQPVVADGTVVAPGFGQVQGFDADTGKKVWQVEDDADLEFLEPVVQGKDLVFSTAVSSTVDVTAKDAPQAKVVALNAASGKKHWSHETSASELSQPVLSGDLVAVGAIKDYSDEETGVLAFDGSSDKPVWTSTAAGSKVSGLAASPDGVFASATRSVIGLAPSDGTKLWQYDFPEVAVDHLLAQDQQVWAVGDADTVVALSADSGAVSSQYQAEAAVVSLTQGEGLVLVGTYGAGLVALHD